MPNKFSFTSANLAFWYHHLFEVMRYGMVGSFSLFTYLFVSNALHALNSPVWFSVATAYFLSLAVSYFGHIYFTYRVQAEHSRMSWRFFILTVVNLIIAQGLTWLIHAHLGYAFWITSVIVGISLPLISWPVGKFWVFTAPKL